MLGNPLFKAKPHTFVLLSTRSRESAHKIAPQQREESHNPLSSATRYAPITSFITEQTQRFIC